jgi:hypothetical protein
MSDPSLIAVFLRKLLYFDSPVVRRLLEMAAVLALIWLAAIAKQRAPVELGFVAGIIITLGPIILFLQFMFLFMTIITAAIREQDAQVSKRDGNSDHKSPPDSE